MAEILQHPWDAAIMAFIVAVAWLIAWSLFRAAVLGFAKLIRDVWYIVTGKKLDD